MTCREVGVVACSPPKTQDGADIALLLAALADASFLTLPAPGPEPSVNQGLQL
ncbi:hypothetical protein M3E01_04235 [Corynebacterium kefirresidentii]|uniref:hypothetical protein n=1 Tax=Corynebacterium kefirresidentii TaxID=1979527 RepID=UPI00223B252F|nr:hypothetical protein [Corynebacterium kefirresidentii]MCT2187966.1 hypothetical protein [Corynebacterium kefirresidentii]